MSFLADIFLSAVNPLFFRSAVKKSALRAFVYYLIFTTIYTLAVCGALFWLVSKQWVPIIQVAKNSVPPFSVTLSQGYLSTTLPEPLVFKDLDYGIVVDTSGRELDADAYEHAIVISKTKGIFKKSRFETREYSWAAVPDFELTAAQVFDWLIAYKSTILWSVFGTLALGVIPMIWLFLIPVLLFAAVLFAILAKIVGAPLTYPQSVSVAFYAVTLPTLAVTAFAALAGDWATNAMYWGIYFGWAALGVILCRGLPREPDAPVAVPPPPVRIG